MEEHHERFGLVICLIRPRREGVSQHRKLTMFCGNEVGEHICYPSCLNIDYRSGYPKRTYSTSDLDWVVKFKFNEQRSFGVTSSCVELARYCYAAVSNLRALTEPPCSCIYLGYRSRVATGTRVKTVIIAACKLLPSRFPYRRTAEDIMVIIPTCGVLTYWLQALVPLPAIDEDSLGVMSMDGEINWSQLARQSIFDFKNAR